MHLHQASERGMKKRNVILRLEVTHVTAAMFHWQANDPSLKSKGTGLGCIALGTATSQQ